MSLERGDTSSLGGDNPSEAPLVQIGRDVRGDVHLTVEQITAPGMPVAVTLIIRQGRILMVRRRTPYGELDWQFPAGVVKPHEAPSDVAKEETFFETGVNCEVVDFLGSRLHPVTQLRILYFRAEYLAGEAENLDSQENRDVCWVPLEEVYSLVPRRQIFNPVRDMIEWSMEMADAKVIVAAVITDESRVLLIQRRVSEGKLLWAFVSGEIEQGESPQVAATREAREELGVAVVATQTIGTRVHPITQRKMVYVACQYVQGNSEPQILDNDELSEFRWCDFDEANELTGGSIYDPVKTFLYSNLKVGS